jgi:arsenate reductase
MAGEVGADAEFVQYLKEPPTRERLTWLVKHLEGPPADLVRKDPYFNSLGLDADDYTTPTAVIDLLLAHPRLMQRPLLVKGDRVVIGRPIDSARELLES